jgi:hypothetical protein
VDKPASRSECLLAAGCMVLLDFGKGGKGREGEGKGKGKGKGTGLGSGSGVIEIHCSLFLALRPPFRGHENESR